MAGTITVILYCFLEKYFLVYTLDLGIAYTYKERGLYKVFFIIFFNMYNMVQVKILLNTEHP